MFAFEVYGCREDLYTAHLGSEAMDAFLKTIPDHTTMDLYLNHYTVVGGFLDRDGDMKECGVMKGTRIVCKSPSARGEVLSRLQALTTGVQEGEKVKREGLLTFMGFECLDNEVGARIFVRFESREVMEAFVRMEDVLGFWRECKENVASMEQHLYVPNGKGWLHREGDRHELGKAL